MKKLFLIFTLLMSFAVSSLVLDSSHALLSANEDSKPTILAGQYHTFEDPIGHIH